VDLVHCVLPNGVLGPFNEFGLKVASVRVPEVFGIERAGDAGNVAERVMPDGKQISVAMLP
jgi:hypothetical protein